MTTAPSHYLERREFLTRKHGRMVVDVRGMTAADWERVWMAYEAFRFQVRAIVWDVQHREAKEVEG